ncbi:hypothetical protein D3C86_2223730 [compost metagenome]
MAVADQLVELLGALLVRVAFARFGAEVIALEEFHAALDVAVVLHGQAAGLDA